MAWLHSAIIVFSLNVLGAFLFGAMVIVLQSTTTVPAIAILLRHAVYYYLIIKNNTYETPGPISPNVLGPFLLRGSRTALAAESSARRACPPSRVDNTNTFARRALTDERASMSSKLDGLDGALGVVFAGGHI